MSRIRVGVSLLALVLGCVGTGHGLEMSRCQAEVSPHACLL